eukprot:18579-Rhodomonas_salina.2
MGHNRNCYAYQCQLKAARIPGITLAIKHRCDSRGTRTRMHTRVPGYPGTKGQRAGFDAFRANNR